MRTLLPTSVSKIFLTFILLFLSVFSLSAQSYVMTSGTVNTCSGTFLDNGGTSNYSNNQNIIQTFIPAPGNKLRVAFSSFNTERNYDGLVIYNGNSTSESIIPSTLPVANGGWFGGENTTNCPAGSYYGNYGAFTVTSTANDGSLTFQFRSDQATVAAGWSATISCIPMPIYTAPASYGPVCGMSNITVSYLSSGNYSGSFRVQLSNAGGTFPANATVNLLPTVNQSTGSITATLPTTPGNYRVRVVNTAGTVSDNDNGSDIVILTQPVLTVSPTAATFCVGTIQAISAPAAGDMTAIKGNGGSTSTAASNNASLGPNPLQNYYGGSKQQMLFTAAELLDLGMTANGSKISNFGVFMSAVSNQTLQNLTVKIGHTTKENLNNTVISTGLSTVFSGNYVPVTGLNNFEFTSEFTWNGSDNLVIEINYSNNNSPNSGQNRATYDATSHVSTWFYRADNQNATYLNGYTMGASYTYSLRNRAQFIFNNTIVPTWTPLTGLYTNAAATTPYTGQAMATVYAKPTVSTTYTASISGTQCNNTANSVLTVNPILTPNFNQVAPICAGSNLIVLPTTSPNGVTGTWSPAMNNTVTTTYTFTPTAGQCATGTTMTIVVKPIVTPIFTQVAQICTGNVLAALPTTSLNNITGTWSPVLTNTTTTTYIFTPADGQCATTASMTITVNPKVTPVFNAIASICVGGTLAALPTMSNNNITGTWSPALNNNVTTTYTFSPANGECANVTTMTITVVPAPAPATIAGGGMVVCAGSNAGTLTLNNYTGTIVKWQSATAADFSDADDIHNTTASLNYNDLQATTYFRAFVTNGICAPVTSVATSVMLGNTTTWNGTSWSDHEPTATSTALIIGNFTATQNIEACTLTVSNNAVVNIPAGLNVILNGKLSVVAGSTFTLENNANLLQSTDVANTGNIIVRRNTSPLLRQDYTLWSSPVAGQNLLAFSPLTVVAPISRFYTYNTLTNTLNSIVTPANETFAPGQGYLIRIRNTHSSTVPSIWPGVFTGVPHNGPYTFTMANYIAQEQPGRSLRYNLVGNPYPSPIDAVQFMNDNAANITDKLYFWRKRNDANTPTYSTWVKAPYTVPGTPRGTFVTSYPQLATDPNGYIQTGQGFFVEAKGNATTLQFNNQQRVAENANQFFKNNNETTAAVNSEYHRLWLNVTNTTGAFCQTAVCYFEGASYDLDAIDAIAINDGPLELYSLVAAQKLVIQGRSIPFDYNDVVPLGLKATTGGTYNIAIDHMDGAFSQNQDVFLKDKLTGIVHDLKAGSYTFTTESGTFDARFEIVYQQASLGINDPVLENAVVIYKQGGDFVINSGNLVMDNVKVFDIRGRLLSEQKAVNAFETTFNAGEANQVLIVKITSDTNQSITRKVVN